MLQVATLGKELRFQTPCEPTALQGGFGGFLGDAEFQGAGGDLALQRVSAAGARRAALCALTVAGARAVRPRRTLRTPQD